MTALIVLFGMLLLIASLTAYLPVSHIAIDLASHFILQYLIASVIVLGIALLCRVQLAAYAPLLAAILLCLFQIIPLLPIQSGAPKSTGLPFKVLQANVLKFNHNAKPLQKLIAQENPDFIFLSEVTPSFDGFFSEMKDAYPYQQVLTSDQTSFGMSLLSKHALHDVQTHYFNSNNIPAIEAHVMVDDRTIRLLSVHLANPLKDFSTRDADMEEISALFKGRSSNMVMAGDFNATPYCHAFSKMRKTLALAEARREQGVMGSYPAWTPFSFLRLPIDHLLAGQNLSVVRQSLGPDIGSDHLPMITVLGLKP